MKSLPIPFVLKLFTMKKKEENYWNVTAEGWTSHIRNRPEADLYRKYILHPLIFELLGEVKQKRILDAGCGEGYLSRMLAEKGAEVVGVDKSEKMLEAAILEEGRNPQGIVFENQDLSALSTFDKPFEKVLSNLVMNILPDFEMAIEKICRNMVSGGSLVIVIPHPAFDGVGAGWVSIKDSNELRWSANRYIDYVDGSASHGAPTFHRPLNVYINAALKSGLVLTGFKEPITPTAYSQMFPPFNRQFDRIPTLVGMRFRKELKSNRN